ncbi:MAG: hypothetical protein EBW34_08125 [Burkholderiaceae bacterium]|nr:hypothetical protein [Burkholderiaceae bacterium]
MFNLAAAASAAFFFSASAFFAASICARVGFGGFASAGVIESTNKEERLSAITRTLLDLNSWLPGEYGGQLLTAIINRRIEKFSI